MSRDIFHNARTSRRKLPKAPERATKPEKPAAEYGPYPLHAIATAYMGVTIDKQEQASSWSARQLDIDDTIIPYGDHDWKSLREWVDNIHSSNG